MGGAAYGNMICLQVTWENILLGKDARINANNGSLETQVAFFIHVIHTPVVTCWGKGHFFERKELILGWPSV